MQQHDDPMQRRLDQLYDQWEAFIDDDPARLLRWVIASQDFRAFEAWLAAESDERAGELPVVFLRFEDPFDDPLAYAQLLRAQLLDAVELAQTDEADSPPDPEDPGPPLADFVPPAATGHHLHDLMALGEALCRHQGDKLPILALVLMPARVSDSTVWMAWLRAAVTEAPESLRLVVFDWAGADALAALVKAEPELVHTEVAELDLSGAAVEISAAAGRLDEPHGQFRHAYVQMLDAIAKRDMVNAQQHALPALELAARQGWGHLEVAIAFGLASGFLQANDPQRAIELYYRAEQRAIAGEEAGEDWAPPLRLKARLAMAAAGVLAEAWPQATMLYLKTVPVAQQLEDTHSELDCLRMASYCRANQGKEYDAWALGLAALEVGEKMDPETRASSTLAYAGVALHRLAERIGADWPPEEQRLVATLGPDWRPQDRPSDVVQMPGREAASP